MKITIDFETRSTVSVTLLGAWAYAEHPTTDVQCMAWKIGEFPVQIWVPPRYHYLFKDKPVFAPLNALQKPETLVEAHNAEFEKAIWRRIMVPRYGWPDIPDHKWRCSAAKAAAHALPRSLDGAAAAMRLVQRKDKEGARIMRKLHDPRKPKKGEPQNGVSWHEDAEDLKKLFAYCMQDVEVEHALSNSLPDLNPLEQKIWLLDAKMNERGVAVDLVAAKKLVDLIQSCEHELLDEVRTLTDGQILSVRQTAKMTEFCGTADLQAATVKEVLETESDPIKRRLLEIRQSLSQSSTAKYSKILVKACSDGRLRGELLYHGASTGRWTGRGVQLQNLPRECMEAGNLDLAFGLVETKDHAWVENLFGDPLSFAKKLIRPVFTATPGHDLIAGDYAQIEARTLLWYAGEEEGLELFRSGADIYCEMAKSIYEREVTKKDKNERQVGKIATLALGYGMGSKKYRLTCHAQAGIEIEQKFARKVVKAYRTRFARVPQLWYSAERAAVQAVLNPDRKIENGKTRWEMNGRFLQCRLPSGRLLSYPDPKIDVMPAWIYPAEDEDKKQTSIMIIHQSEKQAARLAAQRAKEDELTIIGPPIEREKEILSHMAVAKGQWIQETTYGGKLVENIVQATARDIMAEGLLRLEAAGYRMILSVHDEAIAEVPEGFGSVEEFERIMATPPAWAEGCPIAVEGYRSKRYRK